MFYSTAKNVSDKNDLTDLIIVSLLEKIKDVCEPFGISIIVAFLNS